MGTALCPAWVALTPGGWTGSRGAKGASVGWGHTGCPVNQPESEQCPAAPPQPVQEQEQVRVSGDESRSQASCGSPGVHSSCGAVTSRVVPGLRCPVCGVHGSLQGEGYTGPCSSSSSGALPGLSPDLTASLPFHPAPWGQFFTALGGGQRLSAGVVCFQAMGSWCAPGGAELSILPGAPPRTVCDTHGVPSGSCDCSGRVGANLFSSFPGLWYAFSFFLLLSFLSLCHVCVYVFLCVFTARYLKQQANTHCW